MQFPVEAGLLSLFGLFHSPRTDQYLPDWELQLRGEEFAFLLNVFHIHSYLEKLFSSCMLTGIVNVKMRISSPSGHPRCRWGFFSSSEQILRNLAPVHPLQWMGAVRMRVQTDKNITIVHNTTHLTFCELKNCMQ